MPPLSFTGLIMKPKTEKYRFTFRPRNDIRLRKALLKSARLITTFRPDLEERIKIYFIDLGTEFGFTRKHMMQLFEKRVRHVETETES